MKFTILRKIAERQMEKWVAAYIQEHKDALRKEMAEVAKRALDGAVKAICDHPGMQDEAVRKLNFELPYRVADTLASEIRDEVLKDPGVRESVAAEVLKHFQKMDSHLQHQIATCDFGPIVQKFINEKGLDVLREIDIKTITNAAMLRATGAILGKTLAHEEQPRQLNSSPGPYEDRRHRW